MIEAFAFNGSNEAIANKTTNIILFLIVFLFIFRAKCLYISSTYSNAEEQVPTNPVLDTGIRMVGPTYSSFQYSALCLLSGLTDALAIFFSSHSPLQFLYALYAESYQAI